MKQMYYQNRECGNLLTYPEMLKEWAELYDGGDSTNPCGWMEYYTCIGALEIWGRLFSGSRAVVASRFSVNRQSTQIFFRFFVQCDEKYFSQNAWQIMLYDVYYGCKVNQPPNQ